MVPNRAYIRGVQLHRAGFRTRRSLSSRRTNAGICRNSNQILCLQDTRRVSEIGFVRRIFADFAHPTHLGYLDGFGPGSRLDWQLKVHPVAHRAPRSPTHRWHILGILGRFWRVASMPSMRLDDGITRPAHHSCRIAATALAPAAVLTFASATSAMIGRTG